MLTDTAIQKLKVKQKPYREVDRDGLYLLIEPTGKKKWQFRFTWEENGKKKRPWQSLGAYPALSLKQARIRVLESKELLEKGINPIQYKKNLKLQVLEDAKQSKSATEKVLFKDVYDEFCNFKTTTHGQSKPSWNYDTLKKHNERFHNYVLPKLAAKPVDEITEADLRDVLLAIQAHGTLVNRNKVKTVFNGLFDYAAGKGYIPNNIAALIPKSVFVKHQPKNFKHVTTDQEFKVVLKKIANMNGTFEVIQAIKLSMHIFLRPANVASLLWSQIDFENRLITIEAEQMKQERDFIVPLSYQVIELLKSIHELTGYSSYVFNSPYSNGKPISRDSLGNALRRNGIHEISPHGVRHTASTILNEKGYSSDAIEIQLSHIIGGVRGVYNKAQYLDQRREMMQDWSNFVSEHI